MIYKFKLKMLTSYQEFYYKYYSAKPWSSTHWLYLFCVYLIIALPFYFCFGGTNFWIDPKVSQMNLNYNFTGYYAIQVNSFSSSTTSVQEYSNIPGNGMSTPLSTIKNVNFNINDQYNTSTINLQLSSFYSSVDILSLNIILYYDVEIKQMQKIVSKAVSFSIQNSFVSGKITGTLQLDTNQPASGISLSDYTNLPLYYPSQSTGFLYQDLVNNIVQNQGNMNSVTRTDLTYGTTTSSRQVVITLNKVKKTFVSYYPSILQTLKFKYSGYLAIAIIAYYIFASIFKLFIKEGMLESQTITEKIK